MATPTKVQSLTIFSFHRGCSFLRCGYSIDEIEEAAAIALNSKRQMTITKLISPKMDDAVRNRFSSDTTEHVVLDRFASVPRRHSTPKRVASPKPFVRKDSRTAETTLPAAQAIYRRHSTPPPSGQALTPPTRVASPGEPAGRKRITQQFPPTTDSHNRYRPLSRRHSENVAPYQPLVRPTRTASPKATILAQSLVLQSAHRAQLPTVLLHQ
jgi:hypothetical protein